MSEKPVLTYGPAQVGGAVSAGQAEQAKPHRDLKGTVAITVAELRAAALAGKSEDVLLAVQEISAAAPDIVRLCPECRAAFAPRRSDKVYCSERCRNRKSVRDMRRRNANGVKEVTSGV